MKFQAQPGFPVITVGSISDDTIQENGGSIILVNPDEFDSSTEITLRNHFLNKEKEAQSPTFFWEPMPRPRAQTIAALTAESEALDSMLDLERRSREYKIENDIRAQIKRTKQAAKEGNITSNDGEE